MAAWREDHRSLRRRSRLGAVGPGVRQGDKAGPTRPERCAARRSGPARPCLVRSRWSWRRWSCGGLVAEAPEQNSGEAGVCSASLGYLSGAVRKVTRLPGRDPARPRQRTSPAPSEPTRDACQRPPTARGTCPRNARTAALGSAACVTALTTATESTPQAHTSTARARSIPPMATTG